MTETVLSLDAFHGPNDALWRACGRTAPFRCAYLGGTFDLPHVGHFALLARARRLALRTVVAVNSDAFVTRYKGRPPVMPFVHRFAVVTHCRLVDQAVVNTHDEDSRPTILRTGADVVIHGDDWQGPSFYAQLGVTDVWLCDHGVQVVIVPYTPDVSSSLLRARAEASRPS